MGGDDRCWHLSELEDNGRVWDERNSGGQSPSQTGRGSVPGDAGKDATVPRQSVGGEDAEKNATSRIRGQESESSGSTEW